MGNAQVYDSMLQDGLVDAFSNEHSGWHTEDLVSKLSITREAQDRWAARSQQRFAAAQERGFFSSDGSSSWQGAQEFLQAVEY
jgi:acetyl-CoA C-acetyltransferase